MIVLFFGDDIFTLRQELYALRAKFFHWEEVEAGGALSDRPLRQRLSEALVSQGLFVKTKLLILKNLLASQKDYPETVGYLEKTLSAIPPELTLAIVERESFDKRTKLFRLLQKVAKVREFVPPVGDALVSWVKERLKAAKMQAEPGAVEMLLDRVGPDAGLGQISAEFQKLGLYNSGRLDKELVSKIVPSTLKKTVFDLTNAVAEGRIAEAMATMEQVLKTATAFDQKKEIIQIVGALAAQIHSLLLVSEFSGGNPDEVAKTLGWKPGRVWINMKLARKFSQQRLRQLLKDLRAIDLRLKTSEEPPKLLLTLFFQKAAKTG